MYVEYHTKLMFKLKFLKLLSLFVNKHMKCALGGFIFHSQIWHDFFFHFSYVKVIWRFVFNQNFVLCRSHYIDIPKNYFKVINHIQEEYFVYM